MSVILNQYQYSKRNYPNQASILWFNTEGHVELAINGKMYNLCLGMFLKIRSEKEQRTRTLENEGAQYYQFDLALTKKEYNSLSKALTENQRPSCDHCSGSTTRYISKYTDIKIPFMPSRSPTLLARCLFKNPEKYRIKRISSIGAQETIQNAFRKGCLADSSLFGIVFVCLTLTSLAHAVLFLPD